jgi:hypothetical protein
MLIANLEIQIIKNQDRTFVYEIHEKSVHVNDAKRAIKWITHYYHHPHKSLFPSFLPIPSPS